MMKKRIIALLVFGLLPVVLFAQDTSPKKPVSSPKDQSWYALTNAKIITGTGRTIQGTILFRNGIIEEVGENVRIPAGTISRDLKGAFIYPSFIDPYSITGFPPIKPAKREGPVYDRSDQKNLYWNQAIHPEMSALEHAQLTHDSLAKYRKAGFGIVNTHAPDGLIRGSSFIVSTGEHPINEALLKERAALHFSFKKGSSPQDNPGSQMGAIALIRQALYDAQWYQSAKEKEHNASLVALNNASTLPWIFEAQDKLEVLRAARIGHEFRKDFIVHGVGDEYQRAEEIRKSLVKLIIPVQLPKPYDVEDPFDAGVVSLAQLKHWELAPHNARILSEHKIPFAFTMHGLDDPEALLPNIRKMIDAGLKVDSALRALTINPASMLGIADMVGTLEKGKLANFLISSDSIFNHNAILLDHYIRGKRLVLHSAEMADIRGTYDLNLDQSNLIYKLFVSGDRYNPKAHAFLKGTQDSLPVSIQAGPDLITLLIADQSKKPSSWIRLSGTVHYRSGIWDGKGQLQDGRWVNWSAIRSDENFKKKTDTLDRTYPIAGPINYPFTGHGWQVAPKAEVILIRNATVWTSEDTAILKSTDILVRNGKIAAIGKNLDASKIKEQVRFIDATGKHVTPGIIDEHSHIAISKGVNEGSQAITSEVRIGDVLNSEDVNIYRQLAGGVTTAQLLHGSANPIGGQSQIIKLRWGHGPETLKFDSAPPFIKFALGENVKQSNWGDQFNQRFPQTRMGVEQVYYDAFYRARKYRQDWEQYNAISQREREKKNIPAPRVDLELQALAQILEHRRYITCHSYVQSEINMLLHVADSMKFKVNTFTHILEGYKVADKLKAHGAGASTFSDWWGYKMEVADAIPYNAALLHEAGVVTAINSDDAEMGRRLNQEAAKAIKYGGVSEEEALKMITINPAKLLHIDHLTGSIKTGKDADLVIWSGHPLSVTSYAEKTLADGIIYFDRELEANQLKWIEQERARLINAMIKAKKDGQGVVKPSPVKKIHYHCDTLEP